MSQFASFSQDNTDKYPEEVQRLFKPRPPILHRKPLDKPAHLRKTSTITPISQWQSHINEYTAQQKVQKSGKPNETFLENHVSLQFKLQQKQRLQTRQLMEWENATPESMAHYKDPHRTVFVLRLDYRLQELDLLKHFNRFGDIESISVIRDKKGASRGYGFVVFEHETDAQNCIRELAPTGIQIPVEGADPAKEIRTVLIDMERGRLVRNWKPRRLGGGLGGRHYTRPSSSSIRNPHASAAAARSYERHGQSQQPFGRDRRQRQQQLVLQLLYSRPAPTGKAYGDYTRTPSMVPPSVPQESSVSIRDKYAQYMAPGTQPQESQASSTYKYQRTSLSVRSVRNIRGENT